MADDRTQFWILYSGRSVGRYDSDDRDADDPEDVRIRVDCMDRFSGYEKRGQIDKKRYGTPQGSILF